MNLRSTKYIIPDYINYLGNILYNGPQIKITEFHASTYFQLPTLKQHFNKTTLEH